MSSIWYNHDRHNISYARYQGSYGDPSFLDLRVKYGSQYTVQDIELDLRFLKKFINGVFHTLLKFKWYLNAL